MDQKQTDIALLNAALELESLGESEREKFGDMRSSLVHGSRQQLTAKQRAWVKEVLTNHSPQYENLISSGKAPIGRPVEVLCGRLPLSPPCRGPIRWKDGAP